MTLAILAGSGTRLQQGFLRGSTRDRGFDLRRPLESGPHRSLSVATRSSFFRSSEILGGNDSGGVSIGPSASPSLACTTRK
jgi:hypothetical protein